MCPIPNAILHNRRLKGRYANYFNVGYNAFEFVLDFGQYYPENEDAALHTRMITNPISAKYFLEMLQESIKQYEKEHGTINIMNHG